MLSIVNYSSYRQDVYTSRGKFQGGVGRGFQKLKFVKKSMIMKVSWNFQPAGCRWWGGGGGGEGMQTSDGRGTVCSVFLAGTTHNYNNTG